MNSFDLSLAGLEGDQRKVLWTFRRPETKNAEHFSGGGKCGSMSRRKQNDRN